MLETPKLRLYLPVPLAHGTAVAVSADQAHYLANVMRARSGDAVAVFNGRDGEWFGRIEALAKGRATITLARPLREQAPEPDVWLAFAPLKGPRIDMVVEKATELGVAALWPVFTRHTVVSRVNDDRLRAHAVEAAEQCERLSVPELMESTTLERALATWPAGRQLVVMDETGTGAPIAEALPGLSDGPVAFLAGPEGGFAKSELDGLRRLPFVTFIGLGPRILRADTAALAALACWQAWRGDWRQRPAFRSAD